jgi:hypothetical protein
MENFKNNKVSINEGRNVTDGKFTFGGFPKVSKLNENNATKRFNDADDTGGEKIATQPDEEVDLYVKGGMGLRYPSAEYAKMGHEAYDLQTAQFEAQKKGDRVTVADIARKRAAILKQMQSHPHHADFMKTAERHQNDVRGGNYGE